jgi:hypothetical protein
VHSGPMGRTPEARPHELFCAPWQKVAGSHAGVSVNNWVDDAIVEPIISQLIFNGVPVRP